MGSWLLEQECEDFPATVLVPRSRDNHLIRDIALRNQPLSVVLAPLLNRTPHHFNATASGDVDFRLAALENGPQLLQYSDVHACTCMYAAGATSGSYCWLSST